MAIVIPYLMINLRMLRAYCELLDPFLREGSSELATSGVDLLATQSAHFPYFRDNLTEGSPVRQK
jgi:hypothetical protein